MDSESLEVKIVVYGSGWPQIYVVWAILLIESTLGCLLENKMDHVWYFKIRKKA